jgi:hypothetical protein
LHLLQGFNVPPKENIPNSISLPAAFTAIGTLKEHSITANLVLESSFGPAKSTPLFDQRIKTKKNTMSKQNSKILI